MARKYIRGNPNKNYYDNTKFIGTLATGDPIPEGMFRHLVNLDISDTGQSVTPRKGFLTTTIIYNNEKIHLSDCSISWLDPRIGKYIIIDYKYKAVNGGYKPRGYVVPISLHDIKDNYLVVDNVINDFDYLEGFDVLLDEVPDIAEEYNNSISSVETDTVLRKTNSVSEFNSLDSQSDTYVSGDTIIRESNLENIRSVLFNYIGVNILGHDERVHRLRVPVVLNNTAISMGKYKVEYFLYYYLVQVIEPTGRYIVLDSDDVKNNSILFDIEEESGISTTGNLKKRVLEEMIQHVLYNSTAIHEETQLIAIKLYLPELAKNAYQIFKVRSELLAGVENAFAVIKDLLPHYLVNDKSLVNVDVGSITEGPGLLTGVPLHPSLILANKGEKVITLNNGTGSWTHDNDYYNAATAWHKKYNFLTFPYFYDDDDINKQVLRRLVTTAPHLIPQYNKYEHYRVAYFEGVGLPVTIQGNTMYHHDIKSKKTYKGSWTFQHEGAYNAMERYSEGTFNYENWKVNFKNKLSSEGKGLDYLYKDGIVGSYEAFEDVSLEYNSQPTEETLNAIFMQRIRHYFTSANTDGALKINKSTHFEKVIAGQTLYLQVWGIYYHKGWAVMTLQVHKYTINFVLEPSTQSVDDNFHTVYTELNSGIINELYVRQITNTTAIRTLEYSRYKTLSSGVSLNTPLGYAQSYNNLYYTHYIPYTISSDMEGFKDILLSKFVHNFKFASTDVYNYTDMYMLSGAINKVYYNQRILNADESYSHVNIPLYFMYKYNSEKNIMVVNTLNLNENSGIFSPNLVNKNNLIPSTLQVLYAYDNKPYGHVNSTPYTLTKYDDMYYTNHINPSLNYEFIPVYALNPADLSVGDGSADVEWAVAVEVRTETAAVISAWYHLETLKSGHTPEPGDVPLILIDGPDIIKVKNGDIYTNLLSIKDAVKKPFENLSVSFKFIPYYKSVRNAAVDDEVDPEQALKTLGSVWSFQAYASSTSLIQYTTDEFLLRTINNVPGEFHKEIRETSNIVIFEANRFVFWDENNVLMSEEGTLYFKDENKFAFNERVIKVLPFKNTLLVFTVQHMYVIYPYEMERGTGKYKQEQDQEGNISRGEELKEKVIVYMVQPVLYNILVSEKYKNVIQIFNQNILFYSEEGQLYLIRPSQQIDSDTRYTMQMFNKNVNDILLNYDSYINERLEQYFVNERVTKQDVKIDALVSVNDIKIFFYVPGVITYILKYNVLTNQFQSYDTLSFTNINSIHFIEGGEMYMTITNNRRYVTIPYTAFYEDDNNVDMSFYDNFKKTPINALLDTGNINLNNHITKRYRDMHVVFKNLDAHKLLFNCETVIDDVISHPFKNLYVEVQELNGNKITVPVEDINTIDLMEVTHDATGSFGLLFDFKEFLSNRLITYKTSILGTGKVFRLRMQFISKGRYKIQEFGIIYRERSV